MYTFAMNPILERDILGYKDSLLLSVDETQRKELADECDALAHIFANAKGPISEEPMFFPFDVEQDALREDVAEAPLSREEVLCNAPKTQEGQIKVPKVVR